YVNSADPSLFRVIATSPDTDFVITDPQGRKSGYDPLTKQTFSQIPGTTYSKEFSPSEDSTSNTPDQTPSTILVNSQSAIAGSYKIDVYSASAGTAQVSVEGYDASGSINQILPISQAIKAGGHISFVYNHSDHPLVVAQIDLKRADFFEKK